MAVYKLFPEKDATLYSLFPEMNTGLDEILDVSSLNQATNTTAQAARYLVQFDQSEITNVFSSLVGTSSWDADLKCYIADAQGINLDYTLKVFATSGSWGMGTGKYLDNPINTNGTSWKWKTYAGGTAWLTSSFAAGSTGSFSGSAGGGNWYLSPTASQTFNYRSDKDLNVRVTNVVTDWSSSAKENNGFLVKWDSNIEFSQARATQPLLQYYSVDTHTIYPPVLEIKWNDFTWNTGSSTQRILDTPQLYASIANNQGFFYSQSIQQFRVDCRPQFPPIIFQTASIYITNYYLPTASYWAIKDLDTNEYVVDFDSTYTKLSADVTSSYFTVYMNGLQPERYYTIILKTEIAGNTIVWDSDYNFKVING